jgi:hypothetical protein
MSHIEINETILDYAFIKNREYFYNIVTKCKRQVGSIGVCASTPTL